ncbi:MAG: type II toxin-antitoxin system death-on-curing family toxin [Lentimicrobium sp.]|jgi:death-on-curing protein|nr:type II toxin-antitoxin system death-on-curing family toxin [Lentimicrobium sp.]
MEYYLTPEQVLFLHSRLISVIGGGHGVRDVGMLLSALGRPQATFDGKDLYPDIMMKAAALMDSLVRNHPFIDGNKRTAITASAMFLRMNGYLLYVENIELVRFTLTCDQSQLSLEEMAEWFRKFCSEVV